jgi:hypothetical protein
MTRHDCDKILLNNFFAEQPCWRPKVLEKGVPVPPVTGPVSLGEEKNSPRPHHGGSSSLELRLRHHREGEIVPIAAAVAG